MLWQVLRDETDESNADDVFEALLCDSKNHDNDHGTEKRGHSSSYVRSKCPLNKKNPLNAASFNPNYGQRPIMFPFFFMSGVCRFLFDVNFEGKVIRYPWPRWVISKRSKKCILSCRNQLYSIQVYLWKCSVAQRAFCSLEQ